MIPNVLVEPRIVVEQLLAVVQMHYPESLLLSLMRASHDGNGSKILLTLLLMHIKE
jgi:hypothetical protein